MSIFRSTVKTVSGISTHPTRPMLYRTANDALKRLGETAGYRHPIHYYCFRRWVANEANCKLKCTSSSRPPQTQGSINLLPIYLSQSLAKQCVFSKGILLNESETEFSATRVLPYLRSAIMTVVFVATFKMSSSDRCKRISAELQHK